MKRFGGLEVTMAALFCVGAYACAAPEDMPPEVLDAAEKYYFGASATGQTPPAPPPGSTAVTPTPPGSTAVTPTPPATTAVTPGVPPVAPPSATVPPATPPFATPPAILPEQDDEELEPADAIPLDEWLNQ